MAQMSGGMKILLVVLTLAVVGLIGIQMGIIPLSTFGEQGTREQQTKRLTGDCQNEPTIDWSFTNALKSGTSVAVTETYVRRNGVYIGNISTSTKFEYGDNIELLASKSNYIDKKLSPIA